MNFAQGPGEGLLWEVDCSEDLLSEAELDLEVEFPVGEGPVGKNSVSLRFPVFKGIGIYHRFP